MKCECSKNKGKMMRKYKVFTGSEIFTVEAEVLDIEDGVLDFITDDQSIAQFKNWDYWARQKDTEENKFDFMKEKHPWKEFLEARYRAILWFKNDMERDNKSIAQELSVNEAQVHEILKAMGKN